MWEFIVEMLKYLFLPLGVIALVGFLIYCSCIYFIAAWRSKYTKATYFEVRDLNRKLSKVIDLLSKMNDKTVEHRYTVVEPKADPSPASQDSRDKNSDEAPAFPRSAEEYQRLYGDKKTE